VVSVRDLRRGLQEEVALTAAVARVGELLSAVDHEGERS